MTDPGTGAPLAPFNSAQARRGGTSRRRIDRPELVRPFVGVRAPALPTTPMELCATYLPKMADHEFFTHVTAAVIHRMWLPSPLERQMLLDVAVMKPHRAPRDERVQGHHLIDRPHLVRSVRGMRVAGRVETLCQLPTLLRDDDLVVAAESLLTPKHPDRRVLFERIVAAFADEARPWSRRLALVAPRIRIGSRSPQETRARLLLVGAGLPEPRINWRPEDGLFVEGDLVYPEQRVWIEVEGDHHRTDRQQWRNDVVRYERLADLGWRVIRLTDDDLRLRPDETIARIRRALHLA